MNGSLLLWRLLRTIYTRRGCFIWLRHHCRKGTPLQTQIQIAQRLVDGSFL